MSDYGKYTSELIQQFWDYVDAESSGEKNHLESPNRNVQRPPVFRKKFASENILISPETDDHTRNTIVSTLPINERHKYFASMRSSQALAQSVFGNLAARGALSLLSGLSSEEGLLAFGADLERTSMQLEYNVKHLGEPRSTSIDVWFESEIRIAVECKLTEPDFGTCSRPKLRQGIDDNYDRDYCNGTYTQQWNRKTRCSLSEIGVEYWAYIPEILYWKNDQDMSPCAFRNTYQLIRNLLAACVHEDGKIDSQDSHALIIYDASNPAFHDGGLANKQIAAARAALKVPGMLRSLSWQSLVDHLESFEELTWLTGQLRAKYGF